MRLANGLVVVVLASTLTLVEPAGADIRGCTGLDTTDPFKMLVDQLARTQVVTGDQAGQDLMGRLRDVLQGRMTVLMTGSAAFQVLQCPDRTPINDGEFTNAILGSLNVRNVILEVWGTLDAQNVAGEIRARQARIKYLVVPIRAASQASPSLPRTFEATYPKTGSPQSDDYLKLFEQAKEIEAYVSLGVGTKSLRARNYALPASTAAAPGTSCWMPGVGTHPATTRGHYSTMFERRRRRPSRVRWAGGSYRKTLLVRPEHPDMSRRVLALLRSSSPLVGIAAWATLALWSGAVHACAQKFEPTVPGDVMKHHVARFLKVQ